MGKERTSEVYASSLNSFIRFRGEAGDVPLDAMDSVMMMEYEAYLKQNGKCPNTVSFYLRNLRTLYNRASEEGLVENRSPFRHVHTGVEKTVKRGVSSEIIARDLFLLCFYLRGMSFVDLAFLKKKDLQNGVLVYRRHKTDQQLCIKWEQPMQEIVRKYTNPDSPYLLPIIKVPGEKERRQYLNASHVMNKRLQKIGRMVECPISEALGHDSEDTTRIYLALLDSSVVDKANSKVIRSIGR